MKLWLLRPIESLPKDTNPWEPWYDKCFGFVVRCETEEDARKYAHEGAGDENQTFGYNKGTPWLDPKLSTCVELTQEGNPGLVIKDFKSA